MTLSEKLRFYLNENERKTLPPELPNLLDLAALEIDVLTDDCAQLLAALKEFVEFIDESKPTDNPKLAYLSLTQVILPKARALIAEVESTPNAA